MDNVVPSAHSHGISPNSVMQDSDVRNKMSRKSGIVLKCCLFVPIVK